jgi:hypothetical protein
MSSSLSGERDGEKHDGGPMEGIHDCLLQEASVLRLFLCDFGLEDEE